MTRKQKAHPTYSIDSELLEKWQNVTRGEGKQYSQSIEEYMRERLEISNRTQTQVDSRIEAATTANDNENKNLELSNKVGYRDENQTFRLVKRIMELHIQPMIDRHHNDFTDSEKLELGNIIVFLKDLLDKLEIKFKSLRVLRFKEISRYDKTEIIRLEGVKRLRESHEQQERLEILSQLPDADSESHQKEENEDYDANEAEGRLLLFQKKEEECFVLRSSSKNEGGNKRRLPLIEEEVFDEEAYFDNESKKDDVELDEELENNTTTLPTEEQGIIEED